MSSEGFHCFDLLLQIATRNHFLPVEVLISAVLVFLGVAVAAGGTGPQLLRNSWRLILLLGTWRENVQVRGHHIVGRLRLRW